MESQNPQKNHKEESKTAKEVEKKKKLASVRERLGSASKDLSDEALSGILALQAQPSASTSSSAFSSASTNACRRKKRKKESEARAAEKKRGIAVAGKIYRPDSTILSDYTLSGMLSVRAPVPAPPFLNGIFGRHVGKLAERQSHEAKPCLTEASPAPLAEEGEQIHQDRHCVVSSVSSREDTNQPSIDKFSFEEREKINFEKKRERDDIIAAERLPFENLEKIYRERKRQRTTVDVTEDNASAFEHDDTDNALRNMAKQAKTYSTKLVAVKKEMEDTKEDLEDANELVQQQTLTVDVWQSRFDELAEEPGLDAQKINEIRNRPLSSGR